MIAFSGGIGVAYYTVSRQEEARQALAFRREIVFAIDALDTYEELQDEETLRVMISHIYAARELSEGAMWDALHELWNALLFDDEVLLEHAEPLALALKTEDVKGIEAVATAIRF